MYVYLHTLEQYCTHSYYINYSIHYSSYTIYICTDLQSYELKLATLGITSDLELSRVRAWLDRMQRLKKYRVDRIAYIKVRLSVYE